MSDPTIQDLIREIDALKIEQEALYSHAHGWGGPILAYGYCDAQGHHRLPLDIAALSEMLLAPERLCQLLDHFKAKHGITYFEFRGVPSSAPIPVPVPPLAKRKTVAPAGPGMSRAFKELEV